MTECGTLEVEKVYPSPDQVEGRLRLRMTDKGLRMTVERGSG